MTEIEFLSWVRGPGFQIATIIFVVGVIIRLAEILMLGRKRNLAEAKGSPMKCGLTTVYMRSVGDLGTWKRSGFTHAAGYVFHIGLLATLFLFAPHILMFKDIVGFGWPALPNAVIDVLTLISIIALLAVLAHRLTNRVMRHLTNYEDLLVWFVTIAPLLTGYMSFHHIGMTATSMLALHILSVELLMVVFPFTKLMHMFTLFLSRWYNGATAGFRGVQS